MGENCPKNSPSSKFWNQGVFIGQGSTRGGIHAPPEGRKNVASAQCPLAQSAGVSPCLLPLLVSYFLFHVAADIA